ncbi:LCP family protein [Viridibacillus sp. YIM B01967]|uniref:Regulatory protein MsrR n=1 Tax=Viridibacillus soli TaxID=2798301 RepID=A0ABS1H2X0_9BACL|nr:LCP family protein [Viridibacillus soli]MBK3493745.1 LCP family protein [Viridibacillus soli]
MAENEKTRMRNKRRKIRKGRVFITFLLLFLTVVGVYAYTQYKAGVDLANGQKQKKENFIGDEKSAKNIDNILLLGVDSRGEEKSRTDSMILVSWNKDTNDIKMVSFMRDIYADIPNYQSYKLNTAYYLDGVQLLKDTLSNMFDIEINHYALIDFKNFESLVDVVAPNGVEVNVEKNMSKNIGVHLKKGTQQLNGKELLGYARFRKDAQGDFGRVDRQQKTLEALKKEVVSPTNYKNYPKLLGALQGYVQTDITSKEELAFMTSIIKGGDVNIEKLTIPVENSFTFASYPHAGSVIEINKEVNKKALDVFLDFQQ